jgi:hypothetical protein
MPAERDASDGALTSLSVAADEVTAGRPGLALHYAADAILCLSDLWSDMSHAEMYEAIVLMKKATRKMLTLPFGGRP